jgi:hypothetical protein
LDYELALKLLIEVAEQWSGNTEDEIDNMPIKWLKDMIKGVNTYVGGETTYLS